VSTAVYTTLPEYRVAIAELPLSARPASRDAAAVHVVTGNGRWGDAVLAAADAGARAIVVARPGPVPTDDIRALAHDLTGLPVLVERRLLRSDAALRVAKTLLDPRVVTVACAATPDALPGTVRDAVGWLRVLARGTLSLRSRGRGTALMVTGDGVPATLLATVVETGEWVRGHALGETVIEVESDDRGTRTIVHGREGETVLAPLSESPARVALRRALATLESGASPGDLRNLAHDTELAEAIVGTLGHKHP